MVSFLLVLFKGPHSGMLDEASTHQSASNMSTCQASFQLSSNVPGKVARHGSSIWVYFAHTGEMHRVPGLGFSLVPALASVAHWRINQLMENLSVCSSALHHNLLL